MATLALTWIPGGGTATGQRILRIAKVNGLNPNLTTTFTPANDLTIAQSVATAESLQTNTIYRFKVQSICPGGGVVDNSNGVREGIVFECNEDIVDIDSVFQSIDVLTTVSVDLAEINPSPVDGGGAVADYSDIKAIEFSVYDAANAVEVKPPVEELIIFVGSVQHDFANLAPATTYTLRYVLIAEINGVDRRSDEAAYFGVACTKEFITPAAP